MDTHGICSTTYTYKHFEFGQTVEYPLFRSRFENGLGRNGGGGGVAECFLGWKLKQAGILMCLGSDGVKGHIEKGHHTIYYIMYNIILKGINQGPKGTHLDLFLDPWTGFNSHVYEVKATDTAT